MKLEDFTPDELDCLLEVARKAKDDNMLTPGLPVAYRNIIRAVLAKAIELHPGPVLPEWISKEEREPTEADADSSSEVIFLNPGGVMVEHWQEEGYSHWMPCALIAALPKKTPPQDDGFAKWYKTATPEQRIEAAKHGWKNVK